MINVSMYIILFSFVFFLSEILIGGILAVDLQEHDVELSELFASEKKKHVSSHHKKAHLLFHHRACVTPFCQ